MLAESPSSDPSSSECFSPIRYLFAPLRLVPAGATVARRDSHPLGIRRLLGLDVIAALKRGDFANLGGIDKLVLGGNPFLSLPAGVFEGLDETLTVLWLNRGSLQTVPSGVFDRLTGLEELYLREAELALLPPRIFEKLTRLTDLDLFRNPGTARFVPVAKAGPEGGIEVASGGSVTLGVEGAENGFDDPWGANVTWSGPGPGAPGAAGVRPMPVGAAVDGAVLTLTYGQDLEETAPVTASGNGPVYLALVSEPGLRRNIATVRPNAVEVKGRQVRLTLDPPAGYNEVVTLSYFPDKAEVATRVRDRGGNLASAFAGLRAARAALRPVAGSLDTPLRGYSG